MADNLRAAWARLDKKRSHRLRRTLLLLFGTGTAAAVAMPQIRRRLTQSLPPSISSMRARTRDRRGDRSQRPGSTAYNQWTQFEEFPLFMEGVEQVEQLDDTRLHWVATRRRPHAPSGTRRSSSSIPTGRSAGSAKTARRPAAPSPSSRSARARTLIRLSMSYQAEGPVEQLGSAAGLDAAASAATSTVQGADREPRHRERRLARRGLGRRARSRSWL